MTGVVIFTQDCGYNVTLVTGIQGAVNISTFANRKFVDYCVRHPDNKCWWKGKHSRTGVSFYTMESQVWTSQQTIIYNKSNSITDTQISGVTL
jgi:hypothetical protein